MQRWWGVILVAWTVAFAFAFLWSSPAARSGFPLDDAWIHLVYARSLIEGHGLAYNPGELETGLTSPLWTLLISPLLVLTRDHVVPAIKGLGLSLHLLTAWMAARTLLALDVRRSIAIVTAFAIVLEPWSMFAALSGMEVPLTSCLLVAAIFALATQRTALALSVMALLPLARPESLLIVFTLWVVLLRARWSLSPARVRFALLVVPWLGWIAWCVYSKSITGYALPNTFYAKASPSIATWLHNARTLPTMLFGSAWFAFSVIGVLCAWRPIRDRSGDNGSALTALWLVPLAFLFAVVVSQPLKEAHTFYWMRYVLPALPCSLMLATFGLGEQWQRLRTTIRIPAVATIAVVSIAGWIVALPRALEHYTWSCQNIADTHVTVARWLREHTASDDWIATHDAGVIRFVSARPVLDLAGLNNHRIAHGGPTGELARTRPRYFAVFPSWFPSVQRDPRFTRVFSARAEHYVISSAPQDELVVYRFEPSH